MLASCWLLYHYLRFVLRVSLLNWLKPTTVSLTQGIVADSLRNRAELMAENALLRQQLIILQRSVKRSALHKHDKLLLILLASKLRFWQQALLILQPETLLRWHRELFRWLWKRKSKATGGRPRLSLETITLIVQVVRENRLWGAERIRGELLKLGINVSKRTIQRYMRKERDPRHRSQTWSTFLHNHAAHIWACDFVQTYDLFFRAIFVFVIIEHESRRVIHYGVTRAPSQQWVVQQLKEATAFGVAPTYLIRDNDGKYGSLFSLIAKASGIEELHLPPQSPNLNAICERFIGSLRRECLDHILILNERQLHRVVKDYVWYFNRARPHQGIDQRLPDQGIDPKLTTSVAGKIVSRPVLGGLHHDYRRAA
jgi:putative transposase